MSEVECSNEYTNVKNCKQLNSEPQVGERPVKNRRKQSGQYVGDTVQISYRGLLCRSQ